MKKFQITFIILHIDIRGKINLIYLNNIVIVIIYKIANKKSQILCIFFIYLTLFI